MDFDFDEIENELGLIVPEMYRLFIETTDSLGLNLKKCGFYYDTNDLIEGNFFRREQLGTEDPPWKDHYLDIGVGDGCGNYYFLHAKKRDDDLVELWAHDPPGTEDVSTATQFLLDLLGELKRDFQGPNATRFSGER